MRRASLLVVFAMMGCAVDHTGLLPADVDGGGVDAGRRPDVGPDTGPNECNPGGSRPCGVDMGTCVRGMEFCEGGRWSECRDAVGPTMEVCDAMGLDEDCDGMANEDCPCIPDEVMPCNTDDGECDLGEVRCGPDARWGECSTPPGVPETCNGLDDDCDGSTDETVLTPYYPDEDGDTFGVGATVTEACEQPKLHAIRAGDCDDGEEDVFPNAPELCNGRNDDCDASIDEGLMFSDYFVDGDRDGYGTGPAIAFCANPGDEYAQMSGDCNDDSDQARPGLGEMCDTLDNDCSGTNDDGGACGSFCTAAVHADHVYQFCNPSDYTWPEARDYCQSLGGNRYRLVIVDGMEEQNFLTTQALTVSDANRWWIGFNDRDDEGTWLWIDSSPWTYDNFSAGEPNNDRGREDCAEMALNGEWNDSECWGNRFFICESIDDI